MQYFWCQTGAVALGFLLMLVKIKQKIRCGIGAEGDDSSADLFQNLKKFY